MNKELKKAVEAELSSVLTAALTVRNKTAAADISKNIKESAKALAKKFVKHLPPVPVEKKTVKKVIKAKKSATKPVKAVKKENTTVKPTLVK
jgi:hypothetical protein